MLDRFCEKCILSVICAENVYAIIDSCKINLLIYDIGF